MGKKKEERFGRIYRQFTRVKYEKYRLQFPRARQSQLIAKIVKEWEAMDDLAKDDIQKKYDEGSGLNFIDSSSSSAVKNQQKEKVNPEPMSSSAKLAKNKKITKTTKPPSPKVKVFVETSIKKSPEQMAEYVRKERQNSKSPGKKSTPDKGISSSSEIAIQKAKTDSKPSPSEIKAGQYQVFYKYYYQRLIVQHPRWTKPQMTTIIKLLWRKRQTNSQKRRKSVSSKSLSGRQLYNRTKVSEGLLREQVRELWRALPHECKVYWNIKGQGRPNRSEKVSGSLVRKVLNSGASKEGRKENDSGLTWMNHQMK